MSNKKLTGLTGKYAIVNLHRLPTMPKTAEELAQAILANPGIVQFNGDTPIPEFFVVKLQDTHAEPALRAYAASAHPQHPEYANAVQQLAQHAGRFHACGGKQPD